MNTEQYYLIILIIFLLSALIQLIYYLFIFMRFITYVSKAETEDKVPVSIVICARNEANNLEKYLPRILEQNYTDYEVVVVNDCSEDNSYEVLGTFLAQYPNLKISTVNKDPKFTHNKKFAQFIGIKAAKNEILLFTDADCQPESDKWIEAITSHFEDKISFVLGYGGYLKEKGLLNRYIRYDCMTIAMQYLGMAIRGNPYMGVGRNLAYRRSVFFANKGFGAHNHIISGDDDLFVNMHARKSNTSLEFRKIAHTRSRPISSLKVWITQKKRHLTTAPYYKFMDKFRLITELLSRIIFYAAFIVLLSYGFLWPLVSVIFGLRLITQIIIFVLSQKKLNETGLVAYSLIFDIFSPVINALVFLSNVLDNPGKNRWK